MTKEKVKFEGMALEMDVIKKIGHQLNRLEPGGRERILNFVRGWANKTIIAGEMTRDGQLSIAVDKDSFG